MLNKWTRKCLVKLNEAKSIHVCFTNKRYQHIPLTVNYKVVRHSHSEIAWHDAVGQDAWEGTCQK